MKIIGLLREFYTENRGKAITLMLVFAASIFFLVYVSGAWMYQTDEIQELHQAAAEADYSWAFNGYDGIENRNLIEKIQTFDAVDFVAYWQESSWCIEEHDTNMNMMWISQEQYARDPLPISEGTVRMDHSASEIYVVDTTGQYGPGDCLKMTSVDGSQTVTVKVCASIAPESRYLGFTSAAQTIEVEDLFVDTSMIGFYMVGGDCSLINDWFYYRNCLVYYCNDATEQSRQEVREFLVEKGYYSPVEEIIQNSWNQLLPTLKQTMTLPVICMGIAIFAFWVMEVLFLHRKKTVYALMMLCGAKRSTLIGISTFGMVLITLPGIVFGACFMRNIAFFQERWRNIFSEILITRAMYMGLSGVLLAVVVIGMLTAWMELRRTTPIEEYRRTGL